MLLEIPRTSIRALSRAIALSFGRYWSLMHPRRRLPKTEPGSGVIVGRRKGASD